MDIHFNAMRAVNAIVCATCLVWVTGCETTTQMAESNEPSGFLKKSNPAVVLQGEDTEMKGIVQVERVDQKDVREQYSLFGSKRHLPYQVPEGRRTITLESSFNRDGKIYVFQGDLNIEVEKDCNYYPVAGMEANSGKTWMWIQDFDKKVRISDRVEAQFVRAFFPEEEDYLDIWSYESIIDPDVMAERRAACDFSQLPGYEADMSLDRGDMSQREREQ